MGNLGDLVPPGEDSLVRQQRDTERRQQEDAAARRLERSQIGNGGVLKIDGTLQVTGDLEVPAGSLSSAGAMSAGTTVTAGTNVVAGQDVSAVRDVLAGRHVSAANDVTGGGTGSFAAGLTSTGAAGLDLSTIPGTRQAAWQHVSSGRYGYAPSTLESKMNLSESLPFTADDVFAITPLIYEYIGQVAIRDDPANPNYDPGYLVPLEVGLVAQHLIARNMGCFVVFEDDRLTPRTIDYALFGAIANLVAAQDLNRRLRILEGYGLKAVSHSG